MKKNYEIITTLRYKTKDKYRGAIIKIKSRGKDEKKKLDTTKKTR